MSSSAELGAVLATVDEFAARSGAERVVVLLDTGDGGAPLMVERDDDGALAVTEGENTRPARAEPGVEPLPLPRITPVPASAVTADPETGELTAPFGVVQALADSVLALARALGGRSVATATYGTRDPATPLTVAAREGDPVVLDIAGRHFTLPV
jgi:hypothetical protein